VKVDAFDGTSEGVKVDAFVGARDGCAVGLGDGTPV
jgi:hypothetical protein